VSALAEIEEILQRVALPGTWRVDVWEVAHTGRFTGLVELHRNNVPVVEKLLIQGPRTRARVEQELLAALKVRVEPRA
jgi:hypothetical protein